MNEKTEKTDAMGVPVTNAGAVVALGRGEKVRELLRTESVDH